MASVSWSYRGLGGKCLCPAESGSVSLGLRLVEDVGAESAKLVVEERERLVPTSPRGTYAADWTEAADRPVAGVGQRLRRHHNQPQRGGVGGVAALPALAERPGCAAPHIGGQRAQLPDFTEREKMVGEYRMVDIYPSGHLMELVRPSLSKNVLPTVEVESLDADETVRVAGWPVARQHPREQDGTTNVNAMDLRAVQSGITMPASHDWH